MNPQQAALVRRNIREIVGPAVATYTGNFLPFFFLSAAVIPIDLAAGFVQEWANESLAPGPGALMVLVGIVQLAASLLAAAAIIAGLTQLRAARPVVFAEAYRAAIERFSSLWGAFWRMVFHVLLLAATVIGIPWAIQRAVRWVFFEQAVMVESVSAKEALSCSAGVVRGHWCHTLGISLLLWVISFAPAMMLAVLLWDGPVLARALIGPVVNAVTLPFLVIGLTLLYLDLKAGKESVAAGL